MVRVSIWFGPGSGIGTSVKVKSSSVGSPPGGVRASSHCLFMSVLPAGASLLSCSGCMCRIVAQASRNTRCRSCMTANCSAVPMPSPALLEARREAIVLYHGGAGHTRGGSASTGQARCNLSGRWGAHGAKTGVPLDCWRELLEVVDTQLLFDVG